MGVSSVLLYWASSYEDVYSLLSSSVITLRGVRTRRVEPSSYLEHSPEMRRHIVLTYSQTRILYYKETCGDVAKLKEVTLEGIYRKIVGSQFVLIIYQYYYILICWYCTCIYCCELPEDLPNQCLKGYKKDYVTFHTCLKVLMGKLLDSINACTCTCLPEVRLSVCWCWTGHRVLTNLLYSMKMSVVHWILEQRVPNHTRPV